MQDLDLCLLDPGSSHFPNCFLHLLDPAQGPEPNTDLCPDPTLTIPEVNFRIGFGKEADSYGTGIATLNKILNLSLV